ncbi:MAG: hypothetical protein V1647_02010 [Pseudomonadota bacterium]
MMKLRRNKKGMAMLFVMTSVVILAILIIELNYTTRISSVVAANYRDDTAAYYLARSSVNVALLRIAIAKKAKTFEVQGFKIPPAVISLVVSLPFIFPPPPELLAMSGQAEDVGLGAKDMLEKIKKDTNIASVGYFDHNIVSMDSKININIAALNEDSSTIFKEQMKNYYASKVLSDNTFSHRYPPDKFDRVLNNILDWIDPDASSRISGDENILYQKKELPYKTRSAPIPSLNELHMVEEMDDGLFDFISPMISVFSSGGIDVNKSDAEMWKSIDSRFTDDEIKALLEKIQVDGPFTSEQELRTWIGQNTRVPAGEFNPNNVPLSFEEDNYQIEAVGHSGKVSRKIVAYVSDVYRNMMLSGKIPEKPKQDTTGKKTVSFVKPSVSYWEIR